MNSQLMKANDRPKLPRAVSQLQKDVSELKAGSRQKDVRGSMSICLCFTLNGIKKQLDLKALGRRFRFDAITFSSSLLPNIQKYFCRAINFIINL